MAGQDLPHRLDLVLIVDLALLARRGQAPYPERWSGTIRNGEPETVVLLKSAALNR